MWLCSRIDFLAQTGTHVSTLSPPGGRCSLWFPFCLPSCVFCFALSLPLSPFPSPPSVSRYLPLLRVASCPCTSYVLPEYVFFPSSSFSHLLASFVLCSISFVFLFLFFCLACVVVFSCPIRWQFICLNLQSGIMFCFWSSSVSQSVTTELGSL